MKVVQNYLFKIISLSHIHLRAFNQRPPLKKRGSGGRLWSIQRLLGKDLNGNINQF